MKTSQKSRFYAIIVVLISTACLEEVSLKGGEDAPQLVVEGFINDSEEIYHVRLSTTASADGAGINTLGQNASVGIEEIGGSYYTLLETNPGTYSSSAGQILGEVGKSYRLKIRLSNGQEYQSSIETIPNPVKILSGEAIEFSRFVFLYGKDITLGHGINIEVEYIEEPQYFVLENVGWSKKRVFPRDCPRGGFPTTPSVCWSRRDPITRSTIVIGTNIGQSKNYKLTAVESIPVDRKDEYVAVIRTNSMSRENFFFFQSVIDQLDRKGTPFDRPFAPIAGNISAVNHEDIALGYFHTYSTFEKGVCFDRSAATVRVSADPEVFCDVTCVAYWAPATFDNIPALFCQ